MVHRARPSASAGTAAKKGPKQPKGPSKRKHQVAGIFPVESLLDELSLTQSGLGLPGDNGSGNRSDSGDEYDRVGDGEGEDNISHATSSISLLSS